VTQMSEHISPRTELDASAKRLRHAVLLAAAVTPLRAGGAEVDDAAIGPLTEYLRARGVDGIFCCGTTGEGLLLSAEERRRVVERFREACDGALIVNVGSQTTAATRALAAHAADVGVDGVAVVPPPFYPLDADALVEHLAAAADACAPTPFYAYVFTSRSGYPFPTTAIERLRERVDNLYGFKVSEPSLEGLRPFLATRLDVLVGQEMLIPQAMREGARGAASGLASAYPTEVASVVRGEVADGAGEMARLRSYVARHGGMIPGLKAELAKRGVPIRPDVRLPLQASTPQLV
jgi:dihydrodipicolinate synthase/N-acetylneuraminate lyase